MFEICNDKTYFLAETTAKNKTIEITLARDGLCAYTQHREVDATAFVSAMYDEMQIRDKGFSQFHQCGSNREQDGNYYGYQFFEVWSVTDESDAKRMAEIIAKKIGTNIENGG